MCGLGSGSGGRGELRESRAGTDRGPSPASSLHTRAFCRESGPPLLCLSPLRAEAQEGGKVEEGASKGPSPCLTTCLWELGHRPRHHK